MTNEMQIAHQVPSFTLFIAFMIKSCGAVTAPHNPHPPETPPPPSHTAVLDLSATSVCLSVCLSGTRPSASTKQSDGGGFFKKV